AGSLAVGDARVLINAKMDRFGINGIAQRQLTMLGVNIHDLAIGIRRRHGYTDADVASKNIVLVIIQLGINVNPLTFLESKLRYLCAVMEDMGALVEIDSPLSSTINLHREAVAHAINAADRSAYQRGHGRRNRRRIKNRIVPIRRERSGGRRAI